MILKYQISPVFFTWVPPQSSLLSPNWIIRTRSPYFSPKSAIAPDSTACCIGILRCSCKGIFSKIRLFTNCSTFLSSSSVSLAKWEKSKRKVSGATREPFCSTCVPNTSRKAWCNRWVALWLASAISRDIECTSALKGSFKLVGRCSEMWMIRLFSFLVSKI